MACNGYEVIDLGVMVPKETIVETAMQQQVVAICLSGLITPSLAEMIAVVELLESKGCTIPVIVGGATTSLAHTVLKIDPLYSAPVLHSKDASHNVALVNELLVSAQNALQCKAKNAQLRAQLEQKTIPAVSKAVSIDWDNEPVYVPTQVGAWRADEVLTLKKVIPHINWKAYAQAWKVDFDQADKLINEAQEYLTKHTEKWAMRARVGIFPACSDQDTLHVANATFPMERVNGCSLTDFVSPYGDYVGAFAITVDVVEWIKQLQDANQTYPAMVVQLLADRLVEACSQYLFETMQNQWWGFDGGIRPAVGYSCLPNHGLKQPLFHLLDAQDLGITLTENGAMLPQASVCGFYITNKHAKYF
jgi:5-methyltetrahydrofolate--homocysteine methyltransferase